MDITVGPPVVSVHSGDEVVVSARTGGMSPDRQHGYFVADTRVVSAYHVTLCGADVVLINGSATGNHAGRFELTNPILTGPHGDTTPLHLRLDRSVREGVHEDYELTYWGHEPVVCDLEIAIESDFADIFDVNRRILRGTVRSTWDAEALALTTRNGSDRFERAVVIRAGCDPPSPTFANGRMGFRIELSHGQTCIRACTGSPSSTAGPGRPNRGFTGSPRKGASARSPDVNGSSRRRRSRPPTPRSIRRSARRSRISLGSGSTDTTRRPRKEDRTSVAGAGRGAVRP